ncbi:MAG: hypothetical protein NC313_16100 [Butyrivibrio sp.]|nr:hypothetical protein [Butyrivibrio sp.]
MDRLTEHIVKQTSRLSEDDKCCVISYANDLWNEEQRALNKEERIATGKDLAEPNHKLEEQLTQLCCDCTNMRDLLVILNNGMEDYEKIKMEAQGAIGALSAMQDIITTKCWDILEEFFKSQD